MYKCSNFFTFLQVLHFPSYKNIVGVKWYLLVFLINNSLIINDGEHLFICHLLLIFGKMFKCLAHVLIWLFVELQELFIYPGYYIIITYMVWKNVLLFYGCLLTFLAVIFDAQKFYCFILLLFFFLKLYLFIFNWLMIALQYWFDLCHMSTWIAIRVHVSPPSWTSSPLRTLFQPSRLLQNLSLGSLNHKANFHWLLYVW